jgi:hypothetical protein
MTDENVSTTASVKVRPRRNGLSSGAHAHSMTDEDIKLLECFTFAEVKHGFGSTRFGDRECCDRRPYWTKGGVDFKTHRKLHPVLRYVINFLPSGSEVILLESEICPLRPWHVHCFNCRCSTFSLSNTPIYLPHFGRGYGGVVWCSLECMNRFISLKWNKFIEHHRERDQFTLETICEVLTKIFNYHFYDEVLLKATTALTATTVTSTISTTKMQASSESKVEFEKSDENRINKSQVEKVVEIDKIKPLFGAYRLSTSPRMSPTSSLLRNRHPNIVWENKFREIMKINTLFQHTSYSSLTILEKVLFVFHEFRPRSL